MNDEARELLMNFKVQEQDQGQHPTPADWEQGRKQGYIKRFIVFKRYGFIRHGDEEFFFRSVWADGELGQLRANTKVSFVPSPPLEGQQLRLAKDIKLIE